jgi:hypothetical protein
MVGPMVRLVRGPNLLIAAAGILAGGWIALRAIVVPRELLFAALSGIAIGAVGNTWNDMRDVVADRVNRPHTRPLAARLARSGSIDRLCGQPPLAIAFAGLVMVRRSRRRGRPGRHVCLPPGSPFPSSETWPSPPLPGRRHSDGAGGGRRARVSFLILAA